MEVQNPQQDIGGDSQKVSPDSLSYEFSRVLDLNPALADDEEGDDPKPKPKPAPTGNEGTLTKVWQKVKYLLNPVEGLKGAKIAEDAVTRGVLKGVDQLSNTAVRGGVELSKATGAYKLGRDEQEQEAFLNWWDQRTSKANPLQFGEDRIKRWYGPSAGGLTGFVEGASQFAVGMVTVGKTIKAIPAIASLAKTGLTGAAAANALAGAGADMTAFDPHAHRLSNLIEEHAPGWMRNEVTKFLAAKEDDSESLGRVKAGLEGMMLGATLEAMLHGLRGLKAWVKGDKEEAGRLFQEAGEIAQKPRPDEAVKVTETPDGHFAVEENEHWDMFEAQAKAERELNAKSPKSPEEVSAENSAAIQAKREQHLKEIGFEPRTQDQIAVDRAISLSKPRELVLKKTEDRLKGYLEDKNLSAAQRGSHESHLERVQRALYPDRFLGLPETNHFALEHELRPDKGEVRLPPAKGASSMEIPLKKEAPTYSSRSEAENIAVTVNLAAKNERLAKGTFDEASAEQFQKAMRAYAEGADPRTVAQQLEQYGVNINYVQSPEEVISTIKSMVDVMPEPSAITRNRPRTWAETAKEAEGIFKDMSGDEVVERASHIFGSTEGLDSKIDAMRVWLHTQAAQVKKLSQLADANPKNGLAYDQLAKSLDSMLEFHAYFTGTNSNTARALQINKRPVGEAIDAAAKETSSAIDTPESIRAEAETLGADVDEAAIEEAQNAVKEARAELSKAKAGPNTETVADAAQIPGQKPGEVAPKDIEKQGLNDGTRDTEGVNAADFSLARAREKAIAALDRTKKAVPQVDEAVAADNRSLRGERVKMQADAQRAEPLPSEGAGAGEKPKGPINPIEELSKQLDEADAQLTSQLERSRKAKLPKEQKQNLPEEVSPFDTYRVQNGPRSVANMTQAEVRAFARLISMGDSPEEVLALLRGPKMRPPAEIANDPAAVKKWYDYVISFRMEAMLSGPKTQVVNVVNNSIAMMQRPAEYWWAGVRSGDKELRQMGADMFGGMWENSRESWSVAKKAFGDGTNVLDAHNTHTGGNLQKWGDASWLGKIFHAPSRFLLGGDEFFKQMNYRVNLRARILRQAREQNITDPQQLAERLKDGMAVGFNPEGGAVSPSALQYSRVGTFTNELGEGTVGKWLQEGVQDHPMLRVIMPFVRTPVNIFRYAWERTPGLNFANKQFRADWAAGGERKAIAQAKLEMGVAMYSTAALFASTGQITGAGPADPDLRRQWKEAGNQPYSIKIPGTEKWVSYRRLDPVLAPFGLVADAVAISGELHDTERESVAAAVVASVMSNVSSKTFMQGVTEFMDAMSSGRGDVVTNLLSSTATSFIPNVLRQTNSDDTIRETRGYVDEAMARIPGMSTKLEPRRNMFGEKVMLPPGYFNRALNPFTIATKPKNQNVADELIKLGKAFSMPAETKFNGLINLTDKELSPEGKQSPYDRMLELMASPPNGMKSLRAQMEELVQSEGYKSASEDKYVNVGGLKWTLANSIVQAYQEMAWGQVLSEMPKLQTAVQQAAEMQGASLAGGSKGVEDVMQKYTQLFARPTRK